MRFLAFALLAAFAPSGWSMSPFSSDVSDLWWNPAESGWGVNLIQQGSQLFATFFVYAADGRARWYVASDLRGEASGGAQPTIFRGTLYETTGPQVLGTGGFDPAAVTRRAVGAVTFEYHAPNDGMLTYSVDGTTVTKRVTRQTWAMNEVAGDYWVKRVARSACGGGVAMTALGTVAVRRSGNAVTLAASGGALACQFSGIYSQEGRMGRIEGTYTCQDGTSGPFALSEIEVSVWGLVARYQATERGCNVDGNFGGPRAEPTFPPS
jgi:hypothetical protein